MQNLENRDIRQRDIIPPQKLAQCRATVIGVGSIGRQVALQLAAIGTPSLQLIDPDIVAIENLASQGFLEDDLGSAKVHATASMCHQINSQIDIQCEQNRFRRSGAVGNIIFCCVDSIATRRIIWESVGRNAEFFVDGRMSAEVLRVLIACDPTSRANYPTTLFAAGEAYRGSCTSKSTIFCANVAAGLMISAFSNYLRAVPIDSDLNINLLTNELAIVHSL
ncbi:MAG TPA: ThiF family adenylyltransferase [Phycisphaerae bacterium]|nr:ThiF family adenylyltransferase [Phycisphaerae bacterium]